MSENSFTILAGDANGADKAVQRYLADKDYRNVIVHCMTANCRYNVGGWAAQGVAAPTGARGFTYYQPRTRRWWKPRSTDSCSGTA
jgi:adenine-specific DNA-methyltransferase